MNKILRVVFFTFGLITITNCTFPMQQQSANTGDKALKKEEKYRSSFSDEARASHIDIFYSTYFNIFLALREKEFNQQPNPVLVLESVNAHLQYIYSHLQLDDIPSTSVLFFLVCGASIDTRHACFITILDKALAYIDEQKLFKPTVRDQIKKLIVAAKANPAQLADDCPDLDFRHFHQE